MAQNSSTTKRDRPDSIEEALRVLDEALARPSADLKEMIGEDFQHLKSAIGTQTSSASHSVSDMSHHLRDLGTQAFSQLGTFSSDSVATFMNHGKAAVSDVERNIRANPWPYIGGVAVGTLALGFLMGRSAMQPSENVSTTTVKTTV